MSEPKSSTPVMRRPFFYSVCVMGACLAADVTLNLSAIVLHSLSAQKLAKWLAISHDLTYSVAKFIPAIFYVGRQMTVAGYHSRMGFVENVLAMNFLVSMVYAVLITIVGTIEAIKNKEYAQWVSDLALREVRTRLKNNLFWFAARNLATMTIFSLCFFIFMITPMYSGMYFTWDVFPLYANDPAILFICVVFGFVQAMYFYVMLSLVSAILKRSSRDKALQP